MTERAPRYGKRGHSECKQLAHQPRCRSGSRPVRLGNGAWNQQQIDVYGDLFGAAHRLADQLGSIDQDTRCFLVGSVDEAAERWVEMDQAIWEVRGDPRHFLSSKVMCRVGLDRAVALADQHDATDRVDGWTKTRDRIRETVERDGWSDQAGAFTQYVGSTELDAAALMMAIVGFLPADDPGRGRADRAPTASCTLPRRWSSQVRCVQPR